MAGVALLLGAAGVGFWAGRVVLMPPKDPLVSGAEPITYTVARGEVGRSLRFAAVAEWRVVPLARNAASGVVTSVEFVSGGMADPGEVLYTVNLRPVVVAEGEVPAFRPLSLNAEGPDVGQLQSLLAALGFFDAEADGVFRTSTRAAVQTWQRSLGVADDGLVRLGDVVFVPSLPARLALGETVAVGAPLFGGEELVLAVPEAPEFRVPLALEQRDVVPLRAEVRVSYADGVWEGRVEAAVENRDTFQLDLILSAADGGSLCGSDCARWVALGSPTSFGVEIVVLPHTEGPVVPVTGIRSDAGNQPYVVAADGRRIDVVVVASAQGIAVVDGLELGTEIVLPVAPSG